MASSKVVAEYAKSGLSSCKKCSKTIAVKDLRLGLVSRDGRGFDMTKWHHLNCFPMNSESIASPEAIKGFAELKRDDQETLKKLIDGSACSTEKVAVEDEDAIEASKERISKRSRVPKTDEGENDNLEDMNSKKTKVVVEYAKSGRSSCKKCSMAIATKDLRLGLVSRDGRGFDMTKWHHLNCFPMNSESIASPEAINGFAALKSDDQETLKKLIDGSACSTEKVAVEDEDAIEASKEGISKRSRVPKTDEGENDDLEDMNSKKTKVVAEYAKSGRSSCKKCSKTIAAKDLRLGLVSRDGRGFDMTKWHHLNCFPMNSESIASPEVINGFAALESDDQETLKKLIDGSACSTEKVAVEDEDAIEASKERISKRSRVPKTDEGENDDLEDMNSKKTKVVAEYAKSGRSSCKKCSKTIAAKDLRLGLVSRDGRGFDMTKWHHLNCFPMNSESIASPEAINGFVELKIDDQETLKKLIDGSACSTEKVRKTDEGENDNLEDMNSKKTKLSTPAEGVELNISFSISDIKDKYKDATLLPKWKAFQTVIFLERDDGLLNSEKIAAFDFDGCLVKTSVKRLGPDAWSLMYSSIPEKLQSLYTEGYKLVIFTNEANIDLWKNKRQEAVNSKIGRLNNFIKHVTVPIQVFIACGKGKSDGPEDPFRKPKPGMWHLMEQHFNSGISIDMDQSFYVGDAAGREGDHSDADIKFAQGIGLKFYVPEKYFSV